MNISMLAYVGIQYFQFYSYCLTMIRNLFKRCFTYILYESCVDFEYISKYEIKQVCK